MANLKHHTIGIHGGFLDPFVHFVRTVKDVARKCDLNRNIIFITNGELIRALPTYLRHLES